MKKFILTTCIFVAPFFVLYILNLINYDQREMEGDLARMGYFYSNPSPSGIINNQYNLTKKYNLLSELKTSYTTNVDVVTIGDSFSEQGNIGYKNFLANMGVSVIHVDRSISGSNPIQTLITLMNSGLFDKIKPEFIVLQSIERDFNSRTQRIDFNSKIDNINFYKETISEPNVDSNHEDLSDPSTKRMQFFSDATLKMPLNYLQYLFVNKPLTSNTFKVKTTRQDLFTNSPDHLLFYKNDLRKLGSKNDSLKTINSIVVLNELANILSEQDIELIVIVSPDKFDLYYPFIENKSGFVIPRFYSTYENADKKYKNVDTYRILSEKIAEETDVYYYDDTHWSPKGAKIVAEEIYKLMKSSRDEVDNMSETTH